MNFISQILYSSGGMEMSSLLSFMAITVCVGAIVTFFVKAAIILRVQQEDTVNANLRAANGHLQSSNNSNNVRVPRLKMTRVHIPFTFKLIEKANTSYDEVSLSISSQVKYSVQAYWAVSIRELHMSLWRPWTDLQKEASDHSGIVDMRHCQHLALDNRNKLPHKEQTMTLKCPKSPLALGAPPRLSYPLVIFLIREFDGDEVIHPDETVILVNVVHLRDPVCPLPTSILAQYLKQASGQLSCLKQLYLAAGDPLTQDECTSATTATTTAAMATAASATSSSSSSSGGGQQIPAGSLSLAEPVACAGSSGPILCSDGPQAEQLCVVCHYFPLSRALLPCRHTCVCAVCFSKLERCPMCRSSITSYFCIRSEEYLPPNHVEHWPLKSKGSVHWLDALNDRLTDFLGFR